jgi:hypothetical protein
VRIAVVSYLRGYTGEKKVGCTALKVVPTEIALKRVVMIENTNNNTL